jgi:hypothetical protein
MNTVSTKGIIDYEILSFEQYLNYTPKINDTISSKLFWKLFYKKYKKFVWFYGNKIYKISTDPFRMYEVNTEKNTIFLDREIEENYIQKITITVILFILFILPKMFWGLPILSKEEITLFTLFLLFLVYLSFKIPKFIYRFRFNILRK